jgi:hypothetical protein
LTGPVVYRGEDRRCLPVILLLDDPDSGVTYWAHVTSQTVEYTDTRWKIVVPAAQVLGSGATAEKYVNDYLLGTRSGG